ncbi:protein phosphatase [Massilia sp. Root351]|uniref:PP2C family protein-serine/threonine phosphatase n=1 Tax=Massilia sp. Root351 TaxID=1736522 RepID=UPI00070B6C93|nr:protein phosphatase [Massilia sp. Root351]KQV87889.1 protein phosphatase [Massilia sp. Root351]
MASLFETLDFGPSLDIAAHSAASAGTNASQLLENQDNLVLIDANGRAVILHAQVERALQLPNWPRGHVRLAVLDGMGGHGYGRQAAEAVAAGLLRMPACASLDELTARLDALHAQLQQQFSVPGDSAHAGHSHRPGTTLTLLELPAGQVPLLYHVGDSRLYEITREHAQVLTIDHVPATAFAMQGMLDAREWWRQVHGEHRPQIAQAFILGNAFADPQRLDDALCALGGAHLPGFLQPLADRRALAVRSEAIYLLATDGFWACHRPQEWIARWPQLLGGAASAADAVHALFGNYRTAPPPGLHLDNLTAIALRFGTGRSLVNIDETALPAATLLPF